MGRIRLWAIALAAALTALVALPAAALAQPSGRPPTKVVEAAPGAVVDHWTRARMRRAEPLALERRTPSGAEDGGGERERRLHAAFDSHEVPDTTSYPNRVHGKVFFEIGGSPFVCSGTVVNTAARNVVLTAGHCVYDAGGTNRFVDNFLFVPGYRDGSRPFGSWPAETLATTDGWKSESFNYDVGVAVTAAAGGEELQDAVGARGIAFDQPRSQGYDAYGYPAASPFTGQKLWLCESSYFGDDPFYAPPGPAPMGIGCDMTGGSSGGGWVIGGGYTASVNSFGYSAPSEEDHMYGPYFGSVARDLYASVDGAAGVPADRVPPSASSGPPQTTITAGPAEGSSTGDSRPSFSFTASKSGSTFQCSVDSAPFGACSSPRTIGPLSDGEHSFAVRATDHWGQVDPTPASRGFTVADSSAPETSLTGGPTGATPDNEPVFSFDSNEDGTFECRIDGGGFGACSSPRRLGPLSDGRHDFEVRAVDPAGNRDPSPASALFTVDTKVLDPEVAARRKQRQRGSRVRVRVRVGAEEAALASGRGRIKLKGARRSIALKRSRRAIDAGERRVLRLTPRGRRAGRRIERALQRGTRVRSLVSVRLEDPLGNTAGERLSIRLE